MIPKFKVGDKIRFKGTKEGRDSFEWMEYFGKYGIVKGDIGTIINIYTSGYDKPHYFILNPKKGKLESGFLTEDDIEIHNSTMKELLE